MMFLSDQDVDDLLDPAALVEALAAGFARLAGGGMAEPDSVRMNGLGAGSGYLTLFPAHDAATGLATAKVLFGDPARTRSGKSEIDAIVAVADARAGELVALVEARSLTALRTAATSALAARALARLTGIVLPTQVGLVGTGRQARAHARVFTATGLAAGFFVASAAGNTARSQGMVDYIAAATGLPARRLQGPEAVAAEATITVTASLSDVPLLSKPIKHGHVLACVGPFLPQSHEIAPELVAGAALVVSDHPQRLRRQWAGQPAVESLAPERLVSLGDLLAGAVPAPRAGHVLFLSDGRGLEDNIAAGLLLAAARRHNRGLPLR
ncbi:MAG: hypothetical protein NT037_07940 [Hyphomicrobiales bacterium]|jgi:alanine dehydrogenase|nr:hypothetical protein [Hyphomicrobiales bacterium]